MALNPIAYTENVLKSFLRYQLTAYPFADQHLHAQMRELLSLNKTRQSPLFKGPYISLSRPFRPGAPIDDLIGEELLHPHLRERIPREITHLYSHQEAAIRSVEGGGATLVSTGTGSGKTECFLYPIVSKCLHLRDEVAPSGISAIIVYPMNALAEDQLMRLRSLLAGTGITFGMYVGKTPEWERDVAGVRLSAGASRADYEARLERIRSEGSGETVYPAEEVCSREVMRTPGRQPRILLTNVKQLELLLTRQTDVELFAGAQLHHLVFDEAHTFTGALGAETACLIRRLRTFCGQSVGDTACIATSATIVDVRRPEAAINFAARFFGVAEEAVTTVGEDYEKEVWNGVRAFPEAPAGDAAELLDRCVRAVDDEKDPDAAVRTAYRALAGEDLGAGEWPEALHEALSRNELVYLLNEELASPKALDALPAALQERVGRTVAEAEILAWLALGAAARRDGRPLLRPVVHAFVRGISGAVVTFPEDCEGPKLWLAAEDECEPTASHAHFPVTTCTTCGQHYFVTFLKDFSFTGKKPSGGEAGPDGPYWPSLEEPHGGKRVVLVDRLIGDSDDDDDGPIERTATLHFCRSCGAAHPDEFSYCRACGEPAGAVVLHAVCSNNKNYPGYLTRCLSCGSLGRTGIQYREPARPVRAINVADVHVLTQDMVHHSERPRLLVFCDNRQDAAFQAGWMKDHARRFRLRALMAEGIQETPRSIGDLTAFLDETLEQDEALSRALIPEVWQVARREGPGGQHARERRKFLRIQVLREVTLSSRQALGLEPWGRLKVDYYGLDASLPWIQELAHRLALPPNELCEGVAVALDYLRRKRVLYDPEQPIFTRYWQDGDREIQQGYLPDFYSPVATKLQRSASDKLQLVTQWLSSGGDTTMRQMARKWGAGAEAIPVLLTGLFEFLVEQRLLTPVTLKGSRGRAVPGASEVYQVNADLLRLSPNKGSWRCGRCRRITTRRPPGDRCPAWRCDGVLAWIAEDEDDYNLQLLDGAYAMLRPEEHTAMVPTETRERLENLFKGESDAVNCFVCTPTLELGIDIGQLDSVLMRNVPPLPANYWQRAGRAGRRHRMAVDIAYCRPVSHDRAYFADPLKLLSGRIDPPAFNLRNDVMVAKHVHATVITRLHQCAYTPADRAILTTCLPRRVSEYLFENSEIRTTPFDLSRLRDLIDRHADDLVAYTVDVFHKSWPDADANATTSEVLETYVKTFVDGLEEVVKRLKRRLDWAMGQIRRLNEIREQKGTLEPADDVLFRRCDNLVRRLKGTARPTRREAEGHDDFNTFSVLAAEGFLPGYGLETGSVMGWAEIPFWRTGAMGFVLPRPPATALREYVPGNLIYSNGHRFVARRFHRNIDEERSEMPVYTVSVERQAVKSSDAGAGLGAQTLRAIAVCDTDLIHTSHISDEEELRFQMGVAAYGLELDQHSGGHAFQWGKCPVHLRRGVRFRLLNVGASRMVQQGELGYPVCTVCGQSVSPLSSDRQLQHFRTFHAEHCHQEPTSIGFYADVTADVLSLPNCENAVTAYSVLEALRFAAARVLDMHLEDLQILVIGHTERNDVDALLWDPMPGGSGLLDRLCERFADVVEIAQEVVNDCPSECESSCIDCLQTFRNAYYHTRLDRHLAGKRIDTWGRRLAFDHNIPPKQPPTSPAEDAVPVNDAETRLRHLLLAAGFPEGSRNEQIRLERVLGTTTPDVIYRADDFEEDEAVCIYLDGLSRHLHGNPETAERDRAIRSWLRNNGHEVIEIAATDLHDQGAMTQHFRRLANYLGDRKLGQRIREDQDWFLPSDAGIPSV